MRFAPGSSHAPSGFQLVELVVVLSVCVIAAAVAAPGFLRLSAGLRVQLAAGELSGVLHQARSWAIRHNAHVGVKFRTAADSSVSYALYRDGDLDGVRSADIDSGVDPQVAPVRSLHHLGRQIAFGFPPGPPPVDPSDPSRRLDDLDNPIRFGDSDIASFGPLGGSTPGSLYLTDGMMHLSVVRVLGSTGRIRTLTYDVQQEVWR